MRLDRSWMFLVTVGASHIFCPLRVVGQVIPPRALGQTSGDKRVFEKIISQTQKIVVIRHELEGDDKEQAQEKNRDWAKHLPPGETSPLPDHFYTYFFKLSSDDGKMQELWDKPWVDFGNFPSNLTVFDASYEDASANLIFVYKTHEAVFSEVVNTKTMQDASNRKAPPMLLEDDDNVKGIIVESLVLGGSLAKGNLTLSATNNIGERYFFKWRGDQWILSKFKPSLHPSPGRPVKWNLRFQQNQRSF